MYIRIKKMFVDQETFDYKSAYVGVLYSMDSFPDVASEYRIAILKDRHFASKLEAKKFYENIQSCFPVLTE